MLLVGLAAGIREHETAVGQGVQFGPVQLDRTEVGLVHMAVVRGDDHGVVRIDRPRPGRAR